VTPSSCSRPHCRTARRTTTSTSAGRSLSADAFAACARDLLWSAAASGFRRVFVVNGHGGNDQLLRVAAAGAGLAVGGGSYWTLAARELAEMVPPPAPIPGHAGRFETSLALALAPRADLHVPPRRMWAAAEETAYWTEDPDRWRRIDGYTDNPADASPEEGTRWLDTISAAVAAAIVDFARATAR